MPSYSDEEKARRRKMVRGGAVVIAFGVVGALISYYLDSHSFDVARLMGAAQTAFIEFLIFALVGGGMILWHTIGPGGSTRNFDDDPDRPGGY
jgi:hypothetical protein